MLETITIEIFNQIWLKFNTPFLGKAPDCCYLFSQQHEKEAQSVKSPLQNEININFESTI